MTGRFLTETKPSERTFLVVTEWFKLATATRPRFYLFRFRPLAASGLQVRFLADSTQFC